MIELYVLIGIAVVIVGIFTYVQVLKFRARLLERENTILKNNIETAKKVLEQRDKADKAINDLNAELTEQHRKEQVDIEAGIRNQFESGEL